MQCQQINTKPISGIQERCKRHIITGVFCWQHQPDKIEEREVIAADKIAKAAHVPDGGNMTIAQFINKWHIKKAGLAQMLHMPDISFACKLNRNRNWKFSDEEFKRLLKLIKEIQSDIDKIDPDY